MFIMTMIAMSITSNIELIALSAIVIATVLIALFGEKWLEAAIDRNPEWWLEERDMSIKAIWNRRKNK
jgi:hypothetical protein